jgi:hypothetical protein
VAVQFSKELHDDIAAGDITVTFRLWRRRQVKVGGRYRVGRVEIEVDSMDLIRFGAITAAARRPRRPDRRHHPRLPNRLSRRDVNRRPQHRTGR